MERREVGQEALIELREHAHARGGDPRIAERATIVLRWLEGTSINAICRQVKVSRHTVSKWIRRYYEGGIKRLEDESRSGRPAVYGEDCIEAILDTIVKDPQTVGASFSSWSIRNLERYLNEKGVPIKRSRINRILKEEGFEWKQGKGNDGVWVQTEIQIIRERERCPESGLSKLDVSLSWKSEATWIELERPG